MIFSTIVLLSLWINHLCCVSHCWDIYILVVSDWYIFFVRASHYYSYATIVCISYHLVYIWWIIFPLRICLCVYIYLIIKFLCLFRYPYLSFFSFFSFLSFLFSTSCFYVSVFYLPLLSHVDPYLLLLCLSLCSPAFCSVVCLLFGLYLWSIFCLLNVSDPLNSYPVRVYHSIIFFVLSLFLLYFLYFLLFYFDTYFIISSFLSALLFWFLLCYLFPFVFFWS